MRAPLALLTLLCAAPTAADPLTASSPCGGDAFSSAQVVAGPRRGPLVAMPDTLCADLAPQGPPPAVQIDADPIIVPQVGSGGRRVPYGGGLPRYP